MNILSRVSIILLVCFSCIGCDQGTKYLASENLPRNQTSSYLFDSLRVEYTENTGAFLGVGSNLPEGVRFAVFTVMVGLFLFGFLCYLVFYRGNTALNLVALSLMFAGGASNLVDRATNDGAVVDFLNVGIGPLRTGIFNVADIAIVLGVVLVFYATYIVGEEEQS